MASQAFRAARPGASPLLVLVVATAVLYLAREVIIPLALAVLLSFLLAPLVRRLEAMRLGRIVATLLAVVIGVSVIAGVGWVAGNQALNLAGKLPEYKDNISRKLKDMRAPPKGNLGKAAEALKELESEATGKPKGAQKPVPQEPPAVDFPTTPLELVAKLGIPFAALLAIIAAVLVIATLMLLQRDDLRDRIVRLAGEGHMHVTTQAMEDAAGRVSRYLLKLLVVNICYGAPLAAALHFIGIPNAMLWGLLATIFRFVPYVGAPAAALGPLFLAFAISKDWQLVVQTISVIVILEFVIVYVIEPWLYGESTGLSPIAIVFSAIFWTWLWGPIGLLLATPLTVCIAVVGRHIPSFSFLSVILGAEPVLPPQIRFYQRLVALEHDEAYDLAEEFAREHGLLELYDQVLMPALVLAKRDRLRATLDEEREAYVFKHLQQIVGELDVKRKDADKEDDKEAGKLAGKAVPICIVPASDDADFIAAMMLARAIAPDHYEALLVSHAKLASEMIDEIGARGGNAVCISAAPPSAVGNATYLCKRLRQKFPGLKILVALWHAEGIERVRQRLLDAGANEVVARLPEAMERIRLIAPQGAA